MSSITPTSAPKTLSTATASSSHGFASTTVLSIIEAIPPDNPLADQFVSITGVRGSIVDANALATTIAFECLPDAPKCAATKPYTLTEGPSTYAQTVTMAVNTDGKDMTVAIQNNCKVSGTTEMECTNSASISVSAFGTKTATKTKTTTTYGTEDITYTPLTITGGISKLHRPKATQTPTGGAGRAGMGGAAAAAAGAAAGAAIGFF